MQKSLIITEKPSVAQEYARILSVSGKRDGYIENEQYIITWCVGHLVTMSYPEKYDERLKKWNLDDLPFLPDTYKYEVIANVRKQFEVVKTQLNRKDVSTIYYAGDPAREGILIQTLVKVQAGHNPEAEEKCVWIDSQTEEEIRRGIREAKPMSAYDNLAAAGYMRAIEDYAMGINFSRVLSVKYGGMLNAAAKTEKYSAIAVGRVMTCVLGMVVNREREIRQFKETPFYRVNATFRVGEDEQAGRKYDGEWKAQEGSRYFESPLLYKENGFKKREDAEALIESLRGKPAVVVSLDKKTEKKKPPLLFNLAELQAECSKRFKISPDQTLQIAQDLYEKKMTTYPRTDARVLSSAIAKVIGQNLKGLQSFEPTAAFVNEILENKSYLSIAKTQYTDDKKIADHYAIIPTGQTREYQGLDQVHRQVYELIVRRFLSIFYPPAEYIKAALVSGIETEKFFTSVKVLKNPGFLAVYSEPEKTASENVKNAGKDNSSAQGTDDGRDTDQESDNGEEETVLDNEQMLELITGLKKGDVLSVDNMFIKEGKTSPPKRYNSGSMILAMENAGQLIEDEELRAQIKGAGIGTSATRAGILEKLVKIGYLKLNKKTQVLTPEKLGEMVYEVVLCTIPSLLNPKLTASWEKGLSQVENGTTTKEEYLEKMNNFVRTKTNAVKSGNSGAIIRQRIDMVDKLYK